MDDFNNKDSGKLDGFDESRSAKNENGYTVTPEGGFYTKQKEDIIQDEVINSHSGQDKKEPEKKEFKETYNNNSGYNTYGYTPPSPLGFTPILTAYSLNCFGLTPI